MLDLFCSLKRSCRGRAIATILIILTAHVWFANEAAQAANVDHSEIAKEIIRISRMQNVSPALALAIADEGSQYDPNIRHASGGVGVLLVRPLSAMASGLASDADLTDPKDNIRIGLVLLDTSLRMSGGDVQTALEQYFDRSNQPVWTRLRLDFLIPSIVKAHARYNAQANVWGKVFIDDCNCPDKAKGVAVSAGEVVAAGAASQVESKPIAQPAGSLTAPTQKYRIVDGKPEFLLGKNLDDFDGTLGMKRLRLRHRLDDFTGRIRWHDSETTND